MAICVGITGGIASGKSLVANHLRDLGYKIIDSDLIVKDLYQNNKKMLQAIETEFPEVFINHKIQKDLLGKLIFSEEKKRFILNDIVHPIVKEEINKQVELLKYTEKILFIDIPLLFEAKFEDVVDLIVLVYVTKAVQLNRLMERDKIKKKFALQKIHAQLSLEDKKKKADYIIDNNKSVEETKKNIQELLDKISKERI